MKKMFMTAVALVAFSAASMANTKEVKTPVKPVKKAKTEATVFKTKCDYIWIAYYTIFINTHEGSDGSGAAWGYADANASAAGC
jgi:bacteriorhodopsin